MPPTAKVQYVVGHGQNVEDFRMLVSAIHERVFIELAKSSTESHLLFSVEVLISKKQHMVSHKGQSDRFDSRFVEWLSKVNSANNGAQNARDWFHIKLHHGPTVPPV